MYCLIQSHAFTHTVFSLALLQLRVMPCRELVIVSPLSVSFSLSFCNTSTLRHVPHAIILSVTFRKDTERTTNGSKTAFWLDGVPFISSLAWAIHSLLVESAIAVGMLGHWSARVTAGNEISQQELIDVCNACPCFYLRLKQEEGGREHGAQKRRKTKMPKGPLRWKVNCLHKLLLTPEYCIRKVWDALLVICTACIKWASVFYWIIFLINQQ